MNAPLAELRRLAARAKNRRTETGIPRVAMVQGKVPEHQLSTVYEPMVNFILTGSKTMSVGDRTLHYDPATYFVMSVDLPAVGTVHSAADGSPYLAVSLTLVPTSIAALLSDLPKPPSGERAESGFSVAPVTADLLDAWVRMLRLMNRPEDIPALAPAYERELLYRVLQGPLGWMLRDIAAPKTALARVSATIHWIRENFAEPLRIEHRLHDQASITNEMTNLRRSGCILQTLARWRAASRDGGRPKKRAYSRLNWFGLS